LKRTGKIVLMIIVLLGCTERLLSQQLQHSERASRNINTILGLPQDDQGKCGTSAIIHAHGVLNEVSSQIRANLVQALDRLERQKSRLSPSGKFRIHYDTTGIDAPALITGGANSQQIPGSVEAFVDSVGRAFDAAWKFEVDTLGYSAPPTDGLQGGGSEYDVYVLDLGVPLFGQTVWNPSDPIEGGARERFSTFIEIDNDFLGYRTPGINGLMITAAHEFFHAIQIGSYGLWTTVPSMDSWFLELSSVWMEHVAYPAIRDYLLDVPNYFKRFRGSLNQSFPFNYVGSGLGGYERAVWAIFLEKRFGRSIMKDIWTGIKSAPPIGSMAGVLPQRGSSLESEFALFSSWNFYTADRADATRFYTQGADFPRFTPNVSTTFTGLTASVSSAASPLSTQFYQIALASDTITAIVTNTDVTGVQNPSTPKATLQLNLSATDLMPPYQKVAKGLGLTFTAADLSKWRSLYLLSSTKANANTAPEPSPNPFRLAADAKLVLPVQGSHEQTAEVFILNSSVELLFSKQYPVRQSFGNSYIEIAASDLRGSVSTGVCFVLARCGDQEFKWKVAMIQ
jgi:hypothetical protein